MVLLLEHNLVAQLLGDESHVFRVCEPVKIAREEADWDVEVLDGDEGSLLGAVDLLVLSLAVVVERVASVVHHLSVVDKRAVALAAWLVGHEDSKAFEVVDAVMMQ